MNYSPLIFLGILVTLLSSWGGLVLMPHLQLGNLQPMRTQEAAQFYPVPRGGEAALGRELYRANGCIYCHSQQVRAEDFGVDIERGWGQRRSASVDYIYDKPVFLGTMRTGPDLTNIAARQPSAQWHYLHFYNPRAIYKQSVMPSFRWMFTKRKTGRTPSPDALKLPPGSIEPGYEIVPNEQARQLFAYMLTLKTTPTIPEAARAAPAPKPKT